MRASVMKVKAQGYSPLNPAHVGRTGPFMVKKRTLKNNCTVRHCTSYLTFDPAAPYTVNDDCHSGSEKGFSVT